MSLADHQIVPGLALGFGLWFIVKQEKHLVDLI